MPYMDKTPTAPMKAQRDGFTGQRLFVVPKPTVRDALRQPVTKHLMVTDAGFFPHAHHHGASRPQGASENIFLLCTAGKGTVTTPSGEWVVGKGHTILITAGEPHRYTADETDPWTLWWFHVVGTDALELFEAAHAKFDGPHAHLREAAPVALLISLIIDNLSLGTNPGFVRSTGNAWQVLTHVIAEGRRALTESEDPIELALDHVHQSFPARVSVTELAERAGLRESQFNSLFKQRVGVPPLRYQNDLRMAKARELLQATDLSIAEVADACGFADPLYFSRSFSSAHGESATSYRSRAISGDGQ